MFQLIRQALPNKILDIWTILVPDSSPDLTGEKKELPFFVFCFSIPVDNEMMIADLEESDSNRKDVTLVRIEDCLEERRGG